MRTIIKKIMALSILFIFAYSCDLERLPYNAVTDEKMDENSIEAMTRGSYSMLKEEYFYKTTHYINEYGGDNVSLSGTSSDNFYYLYRYQRLNNSNYTADIWQYSYRTIMNINKVINSGTEGKSAEIDQLLGENYYLRAYLYFTLCNIFGRPYVQNPETNLGVPLKLSTDITEFPARGTVKVIYDQIIKDLEKGASLMQSEKDSRYASKEVAYALLSRVYLYMENWAKAKEYADLVINSNRYTLLTGDEYVKYPTIVPEDNTETIIAIRMMKDTDYEKYHMDYYSVGSMYAQIANQGWGEMYPSASYLDLIRQNPTDLRLGYIVDQQQPKNPLWLIYIKSDSEKKTYDFVTNLVRKDGNDYVITENAGWYKSSTVQKEVAGGKTLYYVERSDDNKKYYVNIENAVTKRNNLPQRFIYKCSLQEGQAQLWSPVLIRLAEMYLNRAEANFYLGNVDDAIADVNVIRARAQIPLRVKASATDNSAILKWILDERRLELAFEAHRKLDIFRKNGTLDRRYPGYHLVGASNTVFTTIDPTDKLIIELIPQREMDAYPIPLVQNP